jgi:hypothetical protein
MNTTKVESLVEEVFEEKDTAGSNEEINEAHNDEW